MFSPIVCSIYYVWCYENMVLLWPQNHSPANIPSLFTVYSMKHLWVNWITSYLFQNLPITLHQHHTMLLKPKRPRTQVQPHIFTFTIYQHQQLHTTQIVTFSSLSLNIVIFWRLLADGHSSCHIWCVGFHMVHLGVIQRGQYQSSGDELLHLVKCFLFGWSPLPVHPLFVRSNRAWVWSENSWMKHW